MVNPSFREFLLEALHKWNVSNLTIECEKYNDEWRWVMILFSGIYSALRIIGPGSVVGGMNEPLPIVMAPATGNGWKHKTSYYKPECRPLGSSLTAACLDLDPKIEPNYVTPPWLVQFAVNRLLFVVFSNGEKGLLLERNVTFNKWWTIFVNNC